jgi:hypothetical protein
MGNNATSSRGSFLQLMIDGHEGVEEALLTTARGSPDPLPLQHHGARVDFLVERALLSNLGGLGTGRWGSSDGGT